jgi:hypothetical protein
MMEVLLKIILVKMILDDKFLLGIVEIAGKKAFGQENLFENIELIECRQ